jgi:hypothetical protein
LDRDRRAKPPHKESLFHLEIKREEECFSWVLEGKGKKDEGVDKVEYKFWIGLGAPGGQIVHYTVLDDQTGSTRRSDRRLLISPSCCFA